MAANPPAPRKRRAVTVKQDTRRVPRLPSERDQSPDSQAARDGKPPRKGRQAARDLERGLVDTSTGPVLERTHERLRRGGG